MALGAFIDELWKAILLILGSPFRDLSVLWQLVPLILMWVILELYFGRWTKEELGWNSALANAISLFWIVVSLLQVIFGNAENFSWSKMGVLLFGLLYALFLAVVVFKHALRDKVTYLIASPILIYYLCGVLVLWGHDVVDFSFMILLGFIIIYVFFFGLSELLRVLVPGRPDQDQKSDSDLRDSKDFKIPDESSESYSDPSFDSSQNSALNSMGLNNQTAPQQSSLQPPRPLRHRRESPFQGRR